jgi:uracil-DNA glycosylase
MAWPANDKPSFLHHQVARLDPSWRNALFDALRAPSITTLGRYLDARRSSGAAIYPSEENYLRALELTPLHGVRVVILGQDPYHQPGRADGLAFSMPERPKHSLGRVFKKLALLGVPTPTHGRLDNWARQGVLLLNTTLSVEQGKPKSHARKGWEELTDAIIHVVAEKHTPVVFMLWGAAARAKAALIRAADPDGHHCVLETSHPSGFSARHGFDGDAVAHFVEANRFLGPPPIDWRLPDDSS